MANAQVFRTMPGQRVAPADTKNAAGGVAYSRSAESALAQYVATGCFGATFYASAEEQLAETLALAKRCAPEYVAQAAIMARDAGMKDTPALLLSYLCAADVKLAGRIFSRVVDGVRELRTFVQIHRSGVAGRKSFGTAPRRWIRKWLDGFTDDALFRSSIGDKPSLGDIVKMVHPRPSSPARSALYALLCDRKHDPKALPDLVRAFQSFTKEPTGEPPRVPYQMLEGLTLTKGQWRTVQERMSWQQLRQNLRHLAKKGALDADLVAARLRDPEAIAKVRPFPYQLLMAYRMAADLPMPVQLALQDALELATANVPDMPGRVVVCPDVSGSMHSPVTGARGQPTQVMCVDVAALVSATVLRRYENARVIPFAEGVRQVRINPRDSVMTNAEVIRRQPQGGTDCSAPLRLMNQEGYTPDLVIFVSDNQSWMDSPRDGYFGLRGTGMANEWAALRLRNSKAKLVCIDLQPQSKTQVQDRADVLNVGGFSDRVWTVIARFLAGGGDWTKEVEAVEL